MKACKLSQTELDKTILAWSRSCKVYRPTQARQPAARADCAPGWEMVAGGAPFTMAAGPTSGSVKTFLFPQPEVMLTCSVQSDDPARAMMRQPAIQEEKQIVIGIRPCDARSVLLNNLQFAEDPFYQANRARSILVGFTCGVMCATCFCDQVGGSPMGTEGMDIAVSEINGSFIAEALSPAGEKLLAASNLPAADTAAIAALAARRGSCPPADDTSLDALKKQELRKLYEAPLWNALGESCINCGACTFICPTCFCFDIQDEEEAGKVRRIRYWDSCMFPQYSRHTSGHNPRGLKMQRTRNRFMHKLKYFPDRLGPLSCVGCGRCVTDCPVNIDIREVIRDLLAVE